MRRRNRHRWKKAAKASGKADKCLTKWCRNKRAEKVTVYKRKDGTTAEYVNHLRHCWKCRSRLLKERQPATYVLNMIRHSAKKRDLPFTITLDEFKDFCAKTGYLERRGNQPEDLTIDRVDWDDGYHISNLRVLTHEENSKQGSDNRPRDERTETADDEPF